MKSFICEAQKLEMAVRKAWESVGKPNVFFVKLVEKGNESIFWWKKKNFKIAFFYELKSNIFEINDSFQKDFKKNDKKIFNEKNVQSQKINTEKKPFLETESNEGLKKKDFINNKNNSFEGNFEKRDSLKKNIEKKVFDHGVDEKSKSQNFKSDHFKHEKVRTENIKGNYFRNDNFKNEKSFEIKEEKKNEGFQRKNENLENKNQRFDSSSDSRKRLIWSDRQIKFLKSFSINFYANFFEKKEKIDFFIDNENICKINFGKGPFEDAIKNKDLSLSISTVFSEVLYSKFRDFDIRNCKIIINFE